jgi:MFS transporter, DHA2 family, multidrug resistance protein
MPDALIIPDSLGSAVDPRGVGARPWWALGALAMAIVCIGLDGTVLSVALPTLARKLHASESDLQWFSSGCLLVLAAAMLPAGLLGDRYGRKKVLLASLALFAVGSAACAASPSSDPFIAARLLLGLAGAGIIVMSLAALTVLFGEKERPRAVGIWAAANFVALPIGPILGGWLLTHYWWGWVFLINVPVALGGLIATLALVPESRAQERPGVDLVGVALSILGLVALIYGLIQAGQHGWSNVGAVLEMVCGVALLVGFFFWERRLSRKPGGQPLLDVALFRLPSYTWGVILSAVAIFAMFGVLFTMPQYFQGVLGTSAMGSGLRLLPLIGGLVVAAVPADRIVRLVGAKVAVALGFAILAAGLLIGGPHQRGLQRSLRRGVDGGRGVRDGPRARDLDVSRDLQAVRGTKRGWIGGAAGDQQAGGSARHRDPRQRAKHRLPRPVGPVRAPGRGRDVRPAEHLRGRRGGGQDPLPGTA